MNPLVINWSTDQTLNDRKSNNINKDKEAKQIKNVDKYNVKKTSV